jgi:hypothetical protein
MEYPGVMNRGDRHESILHDDTDRKRFVTTLGEACTKWTSAESHLSTGTNAAGQVAKLRTEPEVQNEFRLEQNSQD